MAVEILHLVETGNIHMGRENTVCWFSYCIKHVLVLIGGMLI
jgi:hypothetical protein